MHQAVHYALTHVYYTLLPDVRGSVKLVVPHTQRGAGDTAAQEDSPWAQAVHGVEAVARSCWALGRAGRIEFEVVAVQGQPHRDWADRCEQQGPGSVARPL